MLFEPEPDAILGFRGKYEFLSNFYARNMVWKDRTFSCSEIPYQMEKCDLAADRALFLNKNLTPAGAKRLGKTIAVRPDWERMRVLIMRDVLTAKFKDAKLRQMLLETGDRHLEETNHWGDTFWGVCDGKGTNVLGNLLMMERKRLRNQS